MTIEIKENVEIMPVPIENEIIRQRVCKDCNSCLNINEFKITCKKDDKIYRTHYCKKCLYEKNKDYMKTYSKNKYQEKKLNKI